MFDDGSSPRSDALKPSALVWSGGLSFVDRFPPTAPLSAPPVSLHERLLFPWHRSSKTSLKPASTSANAALRGTRRWPRTSSAPATKFTSSTSARPSRGCCWPSASSPKSSRKAAMSAWWAPSAKPGLRSRITPRTSACPTSPSAGWAAPSPISEPFAIASSGSRNSSG